jgi:hypothetical protein
MSAGIITNVSHVNCRDLVSLEIDQQWPELPQLTEDGRTKIQKIAKRNGIDSEAIEKLINGDVIPEAVLELVG